MKNKIVRGFLSPFVFVALIAFYSYLLVLRIIDFVNGEDIKISFEIKSE